MSNSYMPPAPAPEFGALIPGPGPCSQQLPAWHRSLGALTFGPFPLVYVKPDAYNP
jgi:hypothetical protein